MVSSAVVRANRALKKERRVQKAEEIRLSGNELFKKGKYAEAAHRYYLAIKVQGPTPILLSNLAAAYLKLDAYDAVEWAATTALEYDPKHLKARFRRAVARRQSLNFSGALYDLVTLLGHNPEFVEAKNELKTCEEMCFLNGGDLSSDEDDKYPLFDDSPWDSHHESDSAEAQHTGTRRSPCRYHNRKGCFKGSLCEYSHAPDNQSVRDEAGRNVCTQFLLGSCKYSKEKCAYSHDKTYLPARGWWNHPDQVDAAKMLHPILCGGEADDIIDELRMLKIKNYAKRRKHKAILEELEFVHIQVMYDHEEQEELGKSIPVIVPTTEPFVLILSLEDASAFNQIHKHLLQTLEPKIRVVQALTKDHVFKCLDSPCLTAILATDPFIARSKNSQLLTRLVDYVKRQGGTLVVGGLFSTHVNSKEFEGLSSAFSLPWKYGSYFRTTFSVNRDNDVAQKNPSLTRSYSMKTLHVADIQPRDAVYCSTEHSRLQSHVFPPTNVHDQEEAPVVQASVGKGSFGFIGDVNGETESTNTMLAMLGLLDGLDETLKRVKNNAGVSQEGVTSSSKGANGHAGQSKKGKKKKKKAASPMISVEPLQHQDGAAETSKLSFDSTIPPPERKSVLVVTLSDPELFESVYKPQLTEISKYADVIRCFNSSDLISQLSDTKNLSGVYVADEGIVQKIHSQALVKLVEYATVNGGTLVFGGLFPNTTPVGQFPTLFTAFGLQWTAGDYYRTQFQKCKNHPLTVKFEQNIPDEIDMKAVTLLDLDASASLYGTASNLNDTSRGCPVLYAQVGKELKGRVGYIGDVNAEKATSAILLAMLDLLQPTTSSEGYRQPFLLVLSESGSIGAPADRGDKELLERLKTRDIEVIYDVSNARAVEHLRSSDLVGVLVASASITETSQAYLLKKLAEYSMNGGALIFGGWFCSSITPSGFRDIFHHNLGLDWDIGPALSNPITLAKNPNSVLCEQSILTGDHLPTTLVMPKLMQVKNIAQSVAVYSTLDTLEVSNMKQTDFTSGFLYAKISNNPNGRIGFLGTPSVNGKAGEVLIAMLGIS